MRKPLSPLFLYLFLCAFNCFSQSAETSPSEKIILDGLLKEINNPGINSTIKILTRVNKFFLVPRNTKEKPFNPSVEQKRKGYVLFSRNSLTPVYHNSSPGKKETPANIKLTAAKGGSDFNYLGIFPLKELKAVSVAVSDLKNGENTLTKNNIKVYFVRHLLKTSEQFIYFPEPMGLQPLTKPVSLNKNIAYSFILDLKVPPQGQAGTYQGELSVTIDGSQVQVPISVQIYDFKLLRPDEKHMNWGFYTAIDHTKEKDYRFMGEQGCNTVVITAKLGDDYMKTLREIRKAGIDGTLVLDIGALDDNIKQIAYTPEWEKEYKAKVAKFAKQMKDAGEADKYIGMIHDEPRETNLNPWNRTFAQMMIYHKLVGEAAPEIRRGVNPMGDEITKKHPKGMYTPFAETFEMIMPHYWKRCRNQIDTANKNPKCQLWSYNDGDNRLAWGLHSWKVGLRGRTLYHYRPYTPTEHPLSPIFMSSREFEGKSFTGNYVIAWKDTLWSTIKFINLREGIQDYCYVYTLEEAIKNAPANKKVAIEKAEKYLQDLKTKIPEYAHAANFSDPTLASDGDSDAKIARELNDIRNNLAKLITEIKK